MVASKSLFLGYSLGGLRLNRRRIVKDFTLLMLHYTVNSHRYNSEQFDATVAARVAEFNARSRTLRMLMYSRLADQRAQNQLPNTVMPYIVLTVAILLVFSVATLYNRVDGQHVEAVLALFVPGMALITTFGLLWALGYAYANILAVMPFLILIIGRFSCFGFYIYNFQMLNIF